LGDRDRVEFGTVTQNVGDGYCPALDDKEATLSAAQLIRMRSALARAIAAAFRDGVAFLLANARRAHPDDSGPVSLSSENP
jgi:hypothetical protein